MFMCSVCRARESRVALVEEIFQIDGKYVVVDHIPATVCVRCGEETFSRETTEKVRLLVHGQAKPAKSIAVEVFEFV
ncbi:MAG: YgiT-type zinc finger protein [Deltaproteobacteria bacterium]|nr:YgiT-type zinc finger protein [Deltaproteobacteria bacterium]